MAVSGRSAPVAMLVGELVAAAAAPPSPLGGSTATVRSFPMLQLLTSVCFSRAAIVCPLPCIWCAVGAAFCTRIVLEISVRLSPASVTCLLSGLLSWTASSIGFRVLCWRSLWLRSRCHQWAVLETDRAGDHFVPRETSAD